MAAGSYILLQIALAAVMFAAVFGIVYAQRQSRTRAWGEVASTLGLHLEPGNLFSIPRVVGPYRGRDLRLDTFTRGTRRHRHTYTRIVVQLNGPAVVRLALYDESVFSQIGKFFGQPDVKSGDEDLDRRFVVKSQPETFARRLGMSANLRSKLLEARSVNVQVDGRAVYFEQRGAETNGVYLRFLFDLLTDLAEFVERA